MRIWLAVLPLVVLACSSTSTNPSGGSGASSGASTGGASSGGASSGGAGSGGSGGAVNADASDDGPSACIEKLANCDDDSDCETEMHCFSCSWVGAACLNSYKDCLKDNSCKCQFACLHECAKVQGPGSDAAGVVDTCQHGCGSQPLATKVLECAVTDQKQCCFNL